MAAYSTEDGALLREGEMPDELFRMSMTPDGDALAVACRDKGTAIVDAETLSVRVMVAGRANATDFSPDGSKLVITGWEPFSVRFYTYPDLVKYGEGVGHSSYVMGVRFSPSGALAVSASEAREIMVWDAESAGRVGGVVRDVSLANPP